ncbi:hypothetical protein ACQ4PT_021028 [Festuca glaucescens]
MACGDPRETLAVVAPPLAVGLRLRGEGPVGARQPRVSAGLQRRLWLGSGASTSGGEDGAFCSPPAVAVPTPVQPSSTTTKQVGSAGARRALILPVPVTPPQPAGQRSRKKMEMQSLRRACTSLSKENTTLEVSLPPFLIPTPPQGWSILPRASGRGLGPKSSSNERSLVHPSAAPATNGFVLPDLNIPAQDITDGSAVTAGSGIRAIPGGGA